MNTEVQISHAQPAPLATPRDRSLPGKVTGRLRRAIEAMVWQGAHRDQAATAAGMTDHSLRSALKKPHVKAFYLSECEVLRTSGRARRIHRLNDMVEQDDNKAAVINAALALDRIEDQHVTGRGAQQSPGFVIQIVNAPAALSTSQREIAAKPLIEHGSGSHEPAALPHQGDADG